jgi:hypothetical protein
MKKNDPPPMTLTRLAELLEAYGAEPQRWPDPERATAQSLLQSDPRAAELQLAARLLDDQLDMFEVAEPSAHLQARVLEIPIRHAPAPAHSSFAGWFAGWRLVALALLPCALGFASGALLTDDAQDDGWNEVSSLVQVADLSDEEWP